ncbi:tape measure protein [Pseudomonas fulva]|uniref:tape measure protein n=1 Tax=Pseudomonas fulva TaxID=47880 RepID=UPI00201E4F26|nr:tape measure protein [Pseudomonas fulva]UQY32657.1 tape measure protein [Pseudomonas fulva]
MANKDLELALRIKADLEQGRVALQELGNAVEGVGTTATETGKNIDAISQAAIDAAAKTTTANDSITASESRLAAAIRNANTELGKRNASLSAPQAGTAAATVTAPVINKAPVVDLTEATRTLTETTQAANVQLNHLGESAEQQTARINAVVAASLAQKRAQDEVAASMQSQNAAARTLNANWKETVAAQNASMNAYHANERAADQKAQAEKQAADQTAKATAESAKQHKALQQLLGTIDRNEKALGALDKREQQLAAHYKAGRLSLEQYTASLDKLRAKRSAITDVGSEAKTSTTQMTGLASAIRSVQRLMLTGFAGYGLTSASRAIVNTNVEWQQAIHTMEAATGSAGAAAQELQFVREVSERLGLELLSTSQSYARLVAAAKESPELGKQIRGVFEGVASAATTLHLGKEEVNGLLLALEQMVSKGKVQTQELVLQLGQRVPGAFGLAAKALGTNTAQLSQWLEKGMIPATEFLPRFGAALQEAYGEQGQKAANGLQGELNRLTNAFTELKIQAGENGFIDSYTTAIRDLKDVLSDPAVIEGLNTLITALGKLIEYGAKGVGGAAAVVKFVAEEVAARMEGPAGDDAVRLEDAVQRETAQLNRAQQLLDDAYRKNDNESAARIERWLSETQERLQRYNDQLNAIYNPAPGAITLPATTVSAPTTPTTPFKPSAGNDTAAKRLAKSNEDWVKQLEKEAATFGLSKAARREYELDQRNLTGALQARAKAAWATLDAAEKQKKADDQAKKDTKLLQQLQLDYLKATGQNVEAAGAEIEKKYGALQKRLTASGNTEGAALVSKLMGIEQAKAELDDLEEALNRVFGEQSRREQTISTQQQAGLISELGARQQILDLNKATAAQVQALLPQMRELAAVTGDPAAIERVKDLETRLANLTVVANQFSNALKSGFETGIQNALRGLADGTMSLQDAAMAFITSISSSMADLASQQLAQMATDGLSSLFGGGATEAAGLATGAAAVTTSAGALSAAGGTLITGASAIQAAATSLAAANSTSAVAGAAKVAVATGGHVTGPGTGTSDSISAMLSNNEFVTRAAVVTQPGALAFLHKFNRYGMAAVNSPVYHSTGGLAGVPAPAMPAPGLANTSLAEPAKNMATTLKNQQNFYLVDDPSRIADVMSGPVGREAVVVAMSRDPAKFRSILGIN